MRVDRGNDVEEAGDDDEAGAPVGYGELDGVGPETHGAAYDVEQSAAEVAEEAEHLQDVVGVGVKTALHGEAEREHADDGDSQQRAAAPFAEKKVSGTGDEPAGDQRKKDESLS